MKTVEFYNDIGWADTGEFYVKEYGCHLWIIPGKIWHREDGPAFINNLGTQEWWINNERHRIGGPSTTNAFQHMFESGSPNFHINGISYTEQEYWALMPKHLFDSIMKL